MKNSNSGAMERPLTRLTSFDVHSGVATPSYLTLPALPSTRPGLSIGVEAGTPHGFGKPLAGSAGNVVAG